MSSAASHDTPQAAAGPHGLTHELRVLDGLHAGARAPLPARLTIGSALDNDIVLSDPGVQARHAVLHWDAAAGRWQLLNAGQDPAGGSGHAPGEALTVGPVRVTVAAANDPFELGAAPALAAPLPAEAADEGATDAPADAQALDAPDTSNVQDPALDESPGQPASAGAAPTAASRWVVWLAAGAVLLAVLVGASLWLFAQGARTPPMAVAKAAPAAVADLRATLQALLQRRGLAEGLQVHGNATQASVRGLLVDAAALEALAAELARLSPRPGLQVWTLEQVRASLRDGGLKLPPSVNLGVDGQGRLLLAGALPSEAAEKALPAAVRALLPPFIAVQPAFEPPAALAQRFIDDARRQGFVLDGRVETQPQGRRLWLQAQVPAAELPRWERWLLGAQQRLGGLLAFSVVLREPASTAAPPRRLPFALASVVGGAQPYLVLADGTRLAPGGRRDGLTLVSIDNDALVLQGTGPAFKVPR